MWMQLFVACLLMASCGAAPRAQDRGGIRGGPWYSGSPHEVRSATVGAIAFVDNRINDRGVRVEALFNQHVARGRGIERFRYGEVAANLWVRSEEETPTEGYGYGKYVELKNGDETIFYYGRDAIGSVLLQAGLVQGAQGLYLVTVWSTGAHSQVALVHDVTRNRSAEEAVVFEFYGPYYVSLRVNANRLVVTADDGQRAIFEF